MNEKAALPDHRIGGFFASWSGGKDSCLALYRVIQAGGKPDRLFTMLVENGDRSHSHGLDKAVLSAQAAALGVPITFRAASWEGYEAAFLNGLYEMRNTGTVAGVFGDIDLAEHLEWVKRVCASAGMAPWEPLWGTKRRRLLAEFVAAGFSATVIAIKGDVLHSGFLGRKLDMALVEEFEALGIDASGELGEYHTVVTDGPIFSAPIDLEHRKAVFRDGYWFLDVAIAGNA